MGRGVLNHPRPTALHDPPRARNLLGAPQDGTVWIETSARPMRLDNPFPARAGGPFPSPEGQQPAPRSPSAALSAPARAVLGAGGGALPLRPAAPGPPRCAPASPPRRGLSPTQTPSAPSPGWVDCEITQAKVLPQSRGRTGRSEQRTGRWTLSDPGAPCRPQSVPIAPRRKPGAGRRRSAHCPQRRQSRGPRASNSRLRASGRYPRARAGSPSRVNTRRKARAPSLPRSLTSLAPSFPGRTLYPPPPRVLLNAWKLLRTWPLGNPIP